MKKNKDNIDYNKNFPFQQKIKKHINKLNKT